MKNPSYWLMKTEPRTYSFEDLLRDKKTRWDGVRNFQARNHLRNMKKGDIALIYHSGDVKAVVGVARIASEAYTEPTSDAGDWSQVDLEPLRALPQPVELQAIKLAKNLKDLPLIKQSRLSVMPINADHYEWIVNKGSR